MRTHRDEKVRQLLAEMARARELVEQHEFEEARRAYAKLRGQCARSGIRSAHVAWGLAVASDGLGDFEAAMAYVREAIEIDPLALPYQRSFDVIVDRVRSTLGDASRAPDDPTTPQLYQLLIQAGEGDVASHLAMARHHHHAGRHRDAMRILDALTVLEPACRPAWSYKALVARALGDDEGAGQAEIEAAVLGGHDPAPFSGTMTARG